MGARTWCRKCAIGCGVRPEPGHLPRGMTSDEVTSVVLSDEEKAAIANSKAAAARGEFATDEQVRAVWAKHGL